MSRALRTQTVSWRGNSDGLLERASLMGNGCCSHGGVTFSPNHATITQDNEGNYNYCVYDSDISTGYGVVALLFLMASQILIMVASQCFCCDKALKLVGSRSSTLLLFITCWVFFFIAEVCLLAGSVRNAYHTKYRTVFTDNPPLCQTLRKGVFGAGAAFVFLNCIVTELYYVFYSKAKESFQPYAGEAAVSMGTYK